MLPYLGLRYLVDGGDVSKDVEAYTAAIVKKLPGGPRARDAGRGCALSGATA